MDGPGTHEELDIAFGLNTTYPQYHEVARSHDGKTSLSLRFENFEWKSKGDPKKLEKGYILKAVVYGVLWCARGSGTRLILDDLFTDVLLNAYHLDIEDDEVYFQAGCITPTSKHGLSVPLVGQKHVMVLRSKSKRKDLLAMGLHFEEFPVFRLPYSSMFTKYSIKHPTRPICSTEMQTIEPQSKDPVSPQTPAREVPQLQRLRRKKKFIVIETRQVENEVSTVCHLMKDLHPKHRASIANPPI